MPRRKKKEESTKLISDMVIIEWIDAEAECTWGDMRDVMEWSKKTFSCREVGWVIEDTKDMIVLTSQLGDENLIGNRSKIPKPWIVSKRTLKWTEKSSKKK